MALEGVLVDGPDLAKRIRLLLAITGTAVRIADAGAHSADEAAPSPPRTITYYLLVDPAMHSAVVLHRDNDNAVIRTIMLRLAAQVSPIAAADLIAEFPGLTGDDPRLEPAARARAARWVQRAMELAQQHGNPIDILTNASGQDADAQTMLDTISASGEMPHEWPVHLTVTTAAYAAAAILHAINAAHRADEVFLED